MRLPVITGFGGVNSAGRMSFHHAYKRMVIDALGQKDQDRTYASLASLMGVDNPNDAESRTHIRENTLIRRIELFDPENVYVQRSAKLRAAKDGEPLMFVMSKRHLPHSIPSEWQVESIDDGHVRLHQKIAGLLQAQFHVIPLWATG